MDIMEILSLRVLVLELQLAFPHPITPGRRQDLQIRVKWRFF